MPTITPSGTPGPGRPQSAARAGSLTAFRPGVDGISRSSPAPGRPCRPEAAAGASRHLPRDAGGVRRLPLRPPRRPRGRTVPDPDPPSAGLEKGRRRRTSARARLRLPRPGLHRRRVSSSSLGKGSSSPCRHARVTAPVTYGSHRRHPGFTPGCPATPGEERSGDPGSPAGCGRGRGPGQGPLRSVIFLTPVTISWARQTPFPAMSG
jgi:hypothetical protein